MAYTERSPDYVDERAGMSPMPIQQDNVHWGAIFAGLVTALSTQLVLSALGAAIGLSSIGSSGSPRSDAGDVAMGVGIWSIISLLISLFVGGWMTSRASGRIHRNTAILNGVILWASVLTLSAWLLTSGVSGAFGLVADNTDTLLNRTGQTEQVTPGDIPQVTAQQTRDIAGNSAKVGWSFVMGSLLGLGAALLGSASGSRSPNTRTSMGDRH